MLRIGTKDDVRALDKRVPDKHDRERIRAECYLVTTSVDGSHEVLQDIAYMRADGGLGEILDAVRVLAARRREGGA